MQYEKTVQDTWDDTAKVSAADGVPDGVEVWARTHGANAYLRFTPKQARRLARALKRAANVAEGKPAKAKKAATLTDWAGDVWRRTSDGTYVCDNGGDVLRRAGVHRVYGIASETA